MDIWQAAEARPVYSFISSFLCRKTVINPKPIMRLPVLLYLQNARTDEWSAIFSATVVNN
jgi:hypothetical protein